MLAHIKREWLTYLAAILCVTMIVMSIGFGKKVYSKYTELVELYPSATFTAHITDAILLKSSSSEKGFLSLLSSLVNETIEKCKETSNNECVKTDDNQQKELLPKDSLFAVGLLMLLFVGLLIFWLNNVKERNNGFK